MSPQIKTDVLQALDAWKAGKPVRSIELGHVHRMIEHPGMSPRVDFSKRLSNDQERAHAYCFHIIEWFVVNAPLGMEHSEFLETCDALEKEFRADNDGLTTEELDGAESLAWKALLVGWKRAIDGHGEVNYIELTNPAVGAKPPRR